MKFFRLVVISMFVSSTHLMPAHAAFDLACRGNIQTFLEGKPFGSPHEFAEMDVSVLEEAAELCWITRIFDGGKIATVSDRICSKMLTVDGNQIIATGNEMRSEMTLNRFTGDFRFSVYRTGVNGRVRWDWDLNCRKTSDYELEKKF